MPASKVATIPKRADFLAAQAGTSFASTGVVVQIHKRGDKNPPRLGITATRKIGGAVTRNRARRRLRALGQTLISRYGKPGHDYVLIARYNTAHLPWQTLASNLTAKLSKHHEAETHA